MSISDYWCKFVVASPLKCSDVVARGCCLNVRKLPLKISQNLLESTHYEVFVLVKLTANSIAESHRWCFSVNFPKFLEQLNSCRTPVNNCFIMSPLSILKILFVFGAHIFGDHFIFGLMIDRNE